MIEILDPGPLTTVQDVGRPGWGHLGVPAGGAADPWSLGVANVVAGNGPDVAALEVTLGGLRVRAVTELTVAVAGADLGATAGHRRLWPGRSAALAAGEELALPGPVEGPGVRAYVAVAGGLDVPALLGSRSTCLAGGFGGYQGRPLRAGDRLALLAAPAPSAPPMPAVDAWPGDPTAPRMVDPDGTVVLRTVAGLEAGPSIAGIRWTVTPASDRMGIRLTREGGGAVGVPAEAPSHGVVRGTIQVPPDGSPIVLGADHQPTGGYAVAGVVITADLPALGQLAPGDAVRFEQVDHQTARSLLRAQRGAWDVALAIAGRDAGWDELWRSAGA